MKVAVYLREDFSESDREQIAILKDEARLDRLATRNEIKEFYSMYGEQWKSILAKKYAEFVQRDFDDLI